MKPYVQASWELTIEDFKDKVAVYIESFDITKPEFKKAKYRILVQGAEPPEVSDPAKFWAIADQFDLILTWNEDTIAKFPEKCVFFEFGTCWIPKEKQMIFPKTKKVSIIASEKNFLEGHKLRHEIVSKYKDQMDVFGRAYKFVETKDEAFADYMFGIIIENGRVNNYFSEKIIDCLRTGTVPIFWGAPNISKFFNSKGFIFFEKADDIGELLPTLTKEKYDEMLPYIRENFEKAAKYAENYDQRIHRIVEDYIEKHPKKDVDFFGRLAAIFGK